MEIRIKSRSSKKIQRLEGSGEIKEILMSEDLMTPQKAKVSICFRGQNTSGIIELTADEIESLKKDFEKRLSIIKETKILKLKK